MMMKPRLKMAMAAAEMLYSAGQEGARGSAAAPGPVPRVLVPTALGSTLRVRDEAPHSQSHSGGGGRMATRPSPHSRGQRPGSSPEPPRGCTPFWNRKLPASQGAKGGLGRRVVCPGTPSSRYNRGLFQGPARDRVCARPCATRVATARVSVLMCALAHEALSERACARARPHPVQGPHPGPGASRKAHRGTDARRPLGGSPGPPPPRGWGD